MAYMQVIVTAFQSVHVIQKGSHFSSGGTTRPGARTVHSKQTPGRILPSSPITGL